MRLQLAADPTKVAELADDDPVAEDETPPGADETVLTPEDEMRWLLVVEGTPTGDGRYIEEGALTWRDLPLPFMALDKTTEGHMEARLVADIVRIEKDGPNVYGWTRFIDSDDDEVLNLQKLIREGSLRGVSVDMDQIEGYMEWAEPVEDDEDRMPIGGDRTVLTAARLMGATAVPFPAFAEAKQEDEPVETADDTLLAALLDPARRLTVRGRGLQSLVAAGHSGYALVWAVANPGSVALVAEGALSPEELHVTIGYYPADMVTDEDLMLLRDMANDYAETSITAEVGGVARIGNDDPQAVALLVESIQLEEARMSLPVQPDMTHPHFVPHVTLGYGIEIPETLPNTIELAGARLWEPTAASEDAEDEDTEEPAEDEEEDPVVASLMASLAAPVAPPDSWFADPEFSGPTPITVTDEGRVFGHVALWKSCHRGFDQCVPPPRSKTGYANFHTGEIKTASGARVRVGHITVDGGHANERASIDKAKQHYDETGWTAADGRCGEDQHGIWFAGSLVPDLDEVKIRKLMSHDVSGDWRAYKGALDLISVRCVPVPGFLKTMYASGEMTAMVASIPVCDDDDPADQDDSYQLTADRIALSIGRHRDQISAERDRIAFGIGRHPAQIAQAKAQIAARIGRAPGDRLEELAARVRG